MANRDVTNNRLGLALFILTISATISITQVSASSELPGHIENYGPFHLSWNSNQTRWDFIFSTKIIASNITQLESLIAPNSTSIKQCIGQKGCLFKEGKLQQSYNTSTFTKEAFIFVSSMKSEMSEPTKLCKESSVKIHNYCSTHWNPPIHITGGECRHTIDWHSPYSCAANQTNYAIPCYLHDPSGKLIDLTHLIMSNGSSYDIDIGIFNKTIKKFHLNICDEASKSCGPNTSSCRSDNNNMIETGYRNLTSISYNAKEELVQLVSLGQYDDKCADKRVRTMVKFQCPKQLKLSKPKLVRADECENIIEWPTVRACPVPDVQAPATNCAIKYQPLGVDIDLRKIFSNQTVVEVSNINIEGKNKTAMLGLCQGINPSTYRCAGKSSKSTSACILDASEQISGTSKNSMIVGSITKSFIKLADSRLLLESFVNNKTCEVPVTRDFNYTRPIGTRIELFCSENDELKPRFVAFEDCVYVFEWGSSKMCIENMIEEPSQPVTEKSIPAKSTIISPETNQTKSNMNLSDFDDASNRTAQDLHNYTLADSKSLLEPNDAFNTSSESHKIEQVEHKSNASLNQPQQPKGKMNKTHKFLMIGLILMSLTAFVVIIFILDRKTNFKIPLGRISRRARQALRPQPVPYSRVSFNDHLDL